MSGAYSLGEQLIEAAELTSIAVFSMSQADAVRKAHSYWVQISVHFVKLATPGPDGPRDHWRKEIEAWIGSVERLVGRMKGKTAEGFVEWAKRARQALDEVFRSGTGSPPPMPG